MTSRKQDPLTEARDGALRRLSGLKRLAAAGSVALVLGFSVLAAHASTESQSTSRRAAVTASDSGRSQSTSRQSRASDSSSGSDSNAGGSSSGSDSSGSDSSSSSSSSAASAPAQTTQAPAVVSGGS